MGDFYSPIPKQIIIDIFANVHDEFLLLLAIVSSMAYACFLVETSVPLQTQETRELANGMKNTTEEVCYGLHKVNQADNSPGRD